MECKIYNEYADSKGKITKDTTKYEEMWEKYYEADILYTR